MHQNRDRSDANIVAPFRRLLEALIPAAKTLNPSFDTSGRTGQNFSRINRDIRFAKDKRPYRPQMYLMLSEPAPKGQEAGQFYVGVTQDLVTAGFRIYGDRKKGPLAEVGRPRAQANLAWLAARGKKLGPRYESYWHATVRGEWVKHEGWPVKAEDWDELQAWIVRRKIKPADAVKPGLEKELEKAFKDLMPFWQMTSAREWNP